MGGFFVMYMKKYRRITNSKEFDLIIRKRRHKTSQSFSVYVKKRQESYPRYGIAVSKKLGNAVLRNKTKRQITNMLREIDCDTYKFDYIILVRRGYFKKTFKENQKDLEKLLKTVKM